MENTEAIFNNYSIICWERVAVSRDSLWLYTVVLWHDKMVLYRKDKDCSRLASVVETIYFYGWSIVFTNLFS